MHTRNIFLAALAALGLAGSFALAQDTPPPAVERPNPPAAERATPPRPDVEAPRSRATPGVEAPRVDTPDVEAADATPDAAADDEPRIVWESEREGPARRWESWGSRHVDDDTLVSIGGNSTLAAGERMDAVVSVFGSSTSAGEVRETVVSVFGSTRVEDGSVRDSAVAVFGNNYVNARVDGDVVAVLGDVELGPKANIGGEVVVIGGTLTRDPAAIVRGGVQHVLGLPRGSMKGLHAWTEHCLAYLRPLAFVSGIWWAWTLALVFLALYVLVGAMFREPVDRGVKLLQESPGKTVVAAILAWLLTPVLLTVLTFTIIGLPFAMLAIFVVTLLGKAIVLAWIGRAIFKLFDDEERLPAALAVLAGGAVMLLLYVVPVLGFIVFNLFGFLALGVVVYLFVSQAKSRRRTSPPPGFGPGSASPASDAPVGGGAAAASMSDAGFGPGPTMAYGAAAAGPAAATFTDDGVTAARREPGFTEFSSDAAASGFSSERDAAATGSSPDFASESTTGPNKEGPFGSGAGAEAGTGGAGTGGAGTGGAGTGGVGTGGAGIGGAGIGGAGTGGAGAGGAGIGGGAAAAGYANTGAPRMSAMEALSAPRAGFWIRMLALAIDVIIVGVAFSILSGSFNLQLIALAAYGAIMWKLKGTTVGGIVCNLKVIRLDGREIDWSTSIVRALGCFLSLIIVGLGFIWIAFDEGKQSWHDKIAGTGVVRVPQGISLL